MTPEQEYKKLYQRMSNLCKQQGWGDPFSYARSKEIYAAIELGHEVSKTFSGADAFNELGYPVEYKSTTGKKAKDNLRSHLAKHGQWRARATIGKRQC